MFRSRKISLLLMSGRPSRRTQFPKWTKPRAIPVILTALVLFGVALIFFVMYSTTPVKLTCLDHGSAHESPIPVLDGDFEFEAVLAARCWLGDDYCHFIHHLTSTRGMLTPTTLVLEAAAKQTLMTESDGSNFDALQFNQITSLVTPRRSILYALRLLHNHRDAERWLKTQR